MPGEKRFGSSLFGFKKSDVNYYIEKILKEFEDKIKEKDNEIAVLKNQNREIKAEYENLAKMAHQINEDRAKIADVLIKAQEQAEQILEEARKQALEEKRNLEQMIEQEREKLVDMKEELKALKQETVNTLKKYESQLTNIIERKLPNEDVG